MGPVVKGTSQKHVAPSFTENSANLPVLRTSPAHGVKTTTWRQRAVGWEGAGAVVTVLCMAVSPRPPSSHLLIANQKVKKLLILPLCSDFLTCDFYLSLSWPSHQRLTPGGEEQNLTLGATKRFCVPFSHS